MHEAQSVIHEGVERHQSDNTYSSRQRTHGESTGIWGMETQAQCHAQQGLDCKTWELHPQLVRRRRETTEERRRAHISKLLATHSRGGWGKTHFAQLQARNAFDGKYGMPIHSVDDIGHMFTDHNRSVYKETTGQHELRQVLVSDKHDNDPGTLNNGTRTLMLSHRCGRSFHWARGVG